MTNPFDGDHEFLVLVNADGQHSLWPSFREIPGGWSAVGASGRREVCLDWIEAHWLDMRPTSLARVRPDV